MKPPTHDDILDAILIAAKKLRYDIQPCKRPDWTNVHGASWVRQNGKNLCGKPCKRASFSLCIQKFNGSINFDEDMDEVLHGVDRVDEHVRQNPYGYSGHQMGRLKKCLTAREISRRWTTIQSFAEDVIRAYEAADKKPAPPKSSVAPDGPAAKALSKTAAEVDKAGYFKVAALTDERRKTLREIVERRGQPKFRNRLIVAYGGRCVVTDCNALAALEAAHILPYRGPKSHHVTNGLLLRADIHTLFDIDLIGIDPESLIIYVAPAIKATVYAILQGRKINDPKEKVDSPNREALKERWNRFIGQAAW